MIQNTGQFDGYPGKDPTSTSKASTLYVINFTYQANCKNNFTLFPLTMRDEAKIWANSFETRKVRTWEQLIEIYEKVLPTSREFKANEGHHELPIDE